MGDAMDPAYKRIAAYARGDNVKEFRDMVEQAHKASSTL
jgi:pullulanase/glycogen debranching enzyme